MQISKNRDLKSWNVIAHSSGSQAAIYVKDKNLEPQVMKLLKRKSRGYYKIITRDELDNMGSYPQASFALSVAHGYIFSNAMTGDFIVNSGRLRGQHGSHPSDSEMYTGLITKGCGFAESTHWKHAHLLEIAPTIANVMGIKSSTFTGKVLPDNSSNIPSQK